MLPINQILQGDCLDVMKTMDDGSVDCVITDPPYNVGKPALIIDMRTKDKRVIGKDFSHFENKIYPKHWIPEISRILKQNGIFITFFKVVRFLIRYLSLYVKEKIFFKKEMAKKIKENGFKVGRLTLVFNGNGLTLYWDGMRLTKGEGFASLFNFRGKLSQKSSCQYWDFERINDNELLLTRSQDDTGLDEIWRLKIIDEKQIDWEIEVNLKNEVELNAARVMLILSTRYHTWIDSWGEGRFYSITDYRNVELRNPNTDFIGLRGRKKLKGQLPTILLELSGNNGTCAPFIKNARSNFGARVLEAQIKNFSGNGKYLPGVYKLFSGRIKIVEENFSKRQLHEKYFL